MSGRDDEALGTAGQMHSRSGAMLWHTPSEERKMWTAKFDETRNIIGGVVGMSSINTDIIRVPLGNVWSFCAVCRLSTHMLMMLLLQVEAAPC